MTHSPYNQNPLDKYTIDSHESVLGHLLKERGWTLQQALSFLAPEVNAQRKGSGLASSVSLTTAIGSSLAAVSGFAFLGLGFALLPAAAAAFNAWQYYESKGQASRREAEFSLHMQFPGLSKLLWELHTHGLPIDQLVHGYDRLVDACQSLLDGYSPGFDLNETTVVEILKDTIRQHETLSAPTVLGIPTNAPIPTPVAAPTKLEPPTAIPTENAETSSAPVDAPPRVENSPIPSAPVEPARPQVSPLPTTIAELQARIKAECPALLRLVKAHPIRLVGIQRTGKSTLAKKLALLRLLLIPEHRVLAATPHYEQSNPYPACFQVVGYRGSGRRDMAEIESAWNQVQQAIDHGQFFNLTPIWDEFGSYADHFEDAEALTLSLRSNLRESIKHGIHPIYVLHGESAQFISGGKGLIRALLQGTVRVETIGEEIDDFGTMAPTGKAIIRWLNGAKEDLVLPLWLTEELLLNFLPSIRDMPTPKPMPISADRARLEASWEASPAPSSHPEVEPSAAQAEIDRILEDEDPVEACILKFLEKRGRKGALVGDLIAHRAKALEGMSAEDIRFYLVLLAEEGKVRSEGSRWFLT